MEQEMQDVLELIEMAEEEDDNELISDLSRQLTELKNKSEKAHLRSLLSGEADDKDAYLEINAGAGEIGRAHV